MNVRQRPWREAVRQAAAEQAEAEARRAWRVEPGEPIPFEHRWEHVRQVVSLALWQGVQLWPRLLELPVTAQLASLLASR